MSLSKVRIGWITIIILVALRVSIGWHFFKEGADKRTSGNFTSVHFLKAAKGPFKGLYHGVLYDPDGQARLDKKETLALWEQFKDQAKGHFGFSEKQAEKANSIYTEYENYLNVWLEENEADLTLYQNELARLQQNKEDASTRDVAFQQARIEKAQRDRASELHGFLAQIDATWKAYEFAINAVADKEQREAAGRLPLPRAGQKKWEVPFIDKYLPLFDLIIGACLIVGLLTRPAAILAALFLFSVILSQPPWVEGAEPIYYQTVEMFALLALAAFGAGRWAGLDYFFGALCCRCCSKKGKKDGPDA